MATSPTTQPGQEDLAAFLPHGTGIGYTVSNVPPAPPPPYVPTFIENAAISVPGGGSFRLNRYYFATPETANYLVVRYGLLGAIAKDVNYGTITVNVQQELVVLPNGAQYPAGLLAWAFIEWPEDKNPGQADAWIKTAIANLMARGAK